MVEASPAGGMLAIDDTTFPKKGDCSVGVTHQYCGELGKRANCQAFAPRRVRCRRAEAVYAGALAGQRQALPPRRLGLRRGAAPARPCARRDREAVQNRDRARSDPGRAIAWDVPFELVTADAAYGHFRTFFEGLEERELSYACAAGVQLRCP